MSGVLHAQDVGGAQGGMAGEGEFAGGAEDADMDAVAGKIPVAFRDGGGVAREDEGGFLEGGFAGEGEHVGVGETSGVGEDDELVAGEAVRGEDVDLDVGEAAGGIDRGGGVAGDGTGGCGGRDGAEECATSEFHRRRIVAPGWIWGVWYYG